MIGWIQEGVLSAACIFFLLFGVHLLIASYGLDNPFWFVMTFFSSSLIILISAALLLGFILRMVARYRRRQEDRQ
ncbi:MAG: hypothetical protein DRH12_12095 [Deltaproteobacteria bacterium]|nr:MAG: hypothetical protein DRH12_12095 [Deltaproteobacteria bacterium]RLB77454.1 MAG: hypothetical protein DRH15_11280 [Deltaproteobacteria bacterium]